MKLTREEEFTWNQVQLLSYGYPRWKRVNAYSFMLHVSPKHTTEEVFHRSEGTWAAGSKHEGTARVFSKLADAFKYGEWLQHFRDLAELETEYCFADSYSGRQLCAA